MRAWSSLATGKLNYPNDVEIDNKNDLNPSNDEIWVADSRNNRIVRMNYFGAILDSYGTIKTGTKGTSGNIANPNSLTLYRDLENVHNHTIALSHTIKTNTEGSQKTNKELVVLKYNGSSFTKVKNLSFPTPSFVTCVQFDQTSSTIYAVDKYNSKIYKYAYNPGTTTMVQLAGIYGGYGTGDHQLNHPVAIHPIVPMPISNGFYRGGGYIGILEEWSDNSGLKIGYEGVDVLDLNLSVSQTDEGGRMNYNYKMPSGVGYIKDMIYQGGEYIYYFDHRNKYGANLSGVWYGVDDMNRLVQNGTYTLKAGIETYWSRGDNKTLNKNFYINTGVETLVVPYSNSFSSSLDANWHHGYGVRMSSSSPHSPSYCLSLGNYDFNPNIGQTLHQWAGFKIDLSSVLGVKELSFWWKEDHESNTSCDVKMQDVNDAYTYYQLYDFPGSSVSDNVWRKTTINLDQARQNYNVGEKVELSFHRNIFFNSNGSIANYSLAIDDVSVTVKTSGETKSTLKYASGDYFSNTYNIGEQNSIENYPNPFNSKTTIHYYLEEDSKVLIEIFNITGQKVSTLASSQQCKGDMNIVWDGRGDNGGKLPTGIYYCRLFIMNNQSSYSLVSKPILKLD